MPVALLVVLAAGGGSRFDGPTHKLEAPFRGSTVVRCAVGAAVDSAAGPVTVVVGAADLDFADLDVTVVRNERWAEGQATSLAVAIGEADRAGADSLVVGLGDQPLVEPAAWSAVATAPEGPIVIAAYGGRSRPPVRLDRSVWALLPRDGDEGARALMRDHPELVRTVDVPGDPVDIDTTDDLVRWS